jgi:hypothetical protein
MDEFLAGHFGQMIANALPAAWNEGAFSALPLRPVNRDSHLLFWRQPSASREKTAYS